MSTLLERLRQARIVRVLALYGSAAFVVLQAIDLFEGQLGLPDWVFQTSVILLLIGLPVVLITAWVESAPHGVGHTPFMARLRQWVTWRRSLTGGLIAFLVMALTASAWGIMRARGIGPAGSLLARGSVNESDQILIAPFSGDSTLAGTLTEAFRIDFTQSRAIGVVRQEQVVEALRRMGRDPRERLTPELAQEVADREGFELLVRGTVAPAGTGYLLTAELVRARGGEVLAAFRESARNLDAVIPSIDRLSKKVRTRIGESLRTLQSEEPLAQLTTSSTEALRLATEAQRAATIDGDLDRAISLYREATVLDPNFAMAWRGLGNWILNNSGPRDEVIAALSRAYELRDRLTPVERYLAEGQYFSQVEGDLGRAIESYRRGVELSERWTINLAYTLLTAARFAESEALLRPRLKEQDRRIYNLYVNLIEAQLQQSKVAAAESSLVLFQQALPDHPRVPRWQHELALQRGDYAAALRAGQALLDNRAPAISAEGSLRLHATHLIQGRLAAAEAVAGGPAMSASVGRARVQLLIGDTVQARRILDAAERVDSTDLQLVFAWAEAGEPDRAETALTRIERTLSAADLKLSEWRRRLMRGAILLASGRSDDAIPLLSDSVILCPLCRLPYLGRAHEQRGAIDDAIRVYTAYLTRGSADRSSNDPFYRAPILEKLAQLHDAAGNVTEARKYYAAFIDLWQDADPVLQPRVQSARARLEQLVRTSG